MDKNSKLWKLWGFLWRWVVWTVVETVVAYLITSPLANTILPSIGAYGLGPFKLMPLYFYQPFTIIFVTFVGVWIIRKHGLFTKAFWKRFAVWMVVYCILVHLMLPSASKLEWGYYFYSVLFYMLPVLWLGELFVARIANRHRKLTMYILAVLAVAGILIAGDYYDVHIHCAFDEPEESFVVESSDTAIVEKSKADNLDWTPGAYQEEHQDEWEVVHQAINLHQNLGQEAFTAVDSLVMGYINRQGVLLPENALERIYAIQEICESRFDFSGYDTSGMGMHIADGAERVFEKYVLWLYSMEVDNCEDIVIDMYEEERIFGALIDSFMCCWKVISGASEGSGAWIAWAEIDRMEHRFMRNMYEAILSSHPVESLPFPLTAKHFEKECALRVVNYKPDMWNETPVDTVKATLDAYSAAMGRWLKYRKRVEKLIGSHDLRQEYDYITRVVVREQYIHLKNIFRDLGYMSRLDEEVLLDGNCTDKEMLDYCYEEAYKRYMQEHGIFR